jgi:hypothetical protein
MQGVNSELESYAGFITVDKPNDGNMFFWFFPAQAAYQSENIVTRDLLVFFNVQYLDIFCK